MSLVDSLGSAAILTTGETTTGVSIEINVSYVSSTYAGVRKISFNRFFKYFSVTDIRDFFDCYCFLCFFNMRIAMRDEQILLNPGITLKKKTGCSVLDFWNQRDSKMLRLCDCEENLESYDFEVTKLINQSYLYSLMFL